MMGLVTIVLGFLGWLYTLVRDEVRDNRELELTDRNEYLADRLIDQQRTSRETLDAQRTASDAEIARLTAELTVMREERDAARRDQQVIGDWLMGFAVVVILLGATAMFYIDRQAAQLATATVEVAELRRDLRSEISARRSTAVQLATYRERTRTLQGHVQTLTESNEAKAARIKNLEELSDDLATQRDELDLKLGMAERQASLLAQTRFQGAPDSGLRDRVLYDKMLAKRPTPNVEDVKEASNYFYRIQNRQAVYRPVDLDENEALILTLHYLAWGAYEGHLSQSDFHSLARSLELRSTLTADQRARIQKCRDIPHIYGI